MRGRRRARRGARRGSARGDRSGRDAPPLRARAVPRRDRSRHARGDLRDAARARRAALERSRGALRRWRRSARAPLARRRSERRSACARSNARGSRARAPVPPTSGSARHSSSSARSRSRRRIAIDAALCCDLLLQLAAVHGHLGDLAGARARLASARSRSRARTAGRKLFAEAALACAGPPLQYRVPDPALSALLDEAFERLPERGALAARLLARRAALHVLDPDPTLPASLRRAAVDSALNAGSAQALAEVLMTPYSGIWESIEPSRRLALIETCVARARAESDRVAEARALSAASQRISRPRRSRVLRRRGRRARGARRRAAGADRVATSCCCTARRGRSSPANSRRCERIGEEALALGRRAGIGGAFELFVAHLSVLRGEQGRLPELTPLGRPLLPEHPSPSARALFLWGRAELGHEEIARAPARTVIELDLPTLGAQPTAVANAAVIARAVLPAARAGRPAGAARRARAALRPRGSARHRHGARARRLLPRAAGVARGRRGPRAAALRARARVLPPHPRAGLARARRIRHGPVAGGERSRTAARRRSRAARRAHRGDARAHRGRDARRGAARAARRPQELSRAHAADVPTRSSSRLRCSTAMASLRTRRLVAWCAPRAAR